MAGETAIKEMQDKYLNSSVNSFYVEDLGVRESESFPNVSVVGRLKKNVEAWEEVGASDFILDTLKSGYKIPFIQTPEHASFQNNLSALRNKDFVTKTIEDLLEKGCIIQVQDPPTVVSPLTVFEKGDKKRLILDLRYVNSHVWKEHVKFEDFRTFQNFIQKGSYMFNFDFKSDYHHIDIFGEHWQYLGCSWEIKGKIMYFRFVVLDLRSTADCASATCGSVKLSIVLYSRMLMS